MTWSPPTILRGLVLLHKQKPAKRKGGIDDRAKIVDSPLSFFLAQLNPRDAARALFRHAISIADPFRPGPAVFAHVEDFAAVSREKFFHLIAANGMHLHFRHDFRLVDARSPALGELGPDAGQALP